MTETCLFLLRSSACLNLINCGLASVVSDSLQPHGLYSPWHSPSQNTGVGSLSLLQGIFPTQGLNSGLPHCRRLLYQLCHKGSPRMLEWVGYPFSRGSSWPRSWTGASHIAGRFFSNWAINLRNLVETLGGGDGSSRASKRKKKRKEDNLGQKRILEGKGFF